MSQIRGFLFLDFLFSLIPIVLMIVLALNASNLFLENSIQNLNEQSKINKLISISDYVVRFAGVEKNQNNFIQNSYYPNKFSIEEFNSINLKDLENRIGLKNLYIGFSKGKDTCIYRLVLDDKKIKKLYFCTSD